MNWWDAAPLAPAPSAAASEDWWSSAPLAGDGPAPTVMDQAPSLGDILVQQIGAGAGPAPLPPAVVGQEPAPLGMPAAPDGLGAPAPLPAAPVGDQSSLAGDLQAAWLQAQELIPGARAGLGLHDVQISDAITAHESADLTKARATLAQMEAATPTIAAPDRPQWDADMDRVREEIAARETKQAQPEYAPAMERVAGEKRAGLNTLAETLPTILDLERRQYDIPMNPAAAELGNAQTFGEGFSALGADPLGVLRTYGIRSLGTSVPSMLAGIVGSAVGGPAGAAVGAGAAGGATEASMTIAQNLEKALAGAGVDVSKPEAIAAYMQANPDVFKGMVATAVTRAGAIAATEAVTGGLTGKIAHAAAESGKAGKIAEAILSGAVLDPAGEMAGEAAANLATTGQLQPGDVLAEGLGAGVMGGPTTAGQVLVETAKLRSQLNRERAAGAETATEAPSAAPVVPSAAAPAVAPLAPAVVPQQPAPLAPAPSAEPSPAGNPVTISEPGVGINSPTISTPASETPTPAPKGAGITEPSAPVIGNHPATFSDAEPPVPQARPFTYLARQAGIQIDPDGPAGKELRKNGITVRTNPGLFKRGGMSDVDNIVAAEHPELHQILGDDGTGNYLPRNGIIDALVSEANGRPVRGAEQQHIAAIRAEWENMQSQTAQVYAADPTPPLDLPEPTIPHPSEDWAPDGDRRQSVEHHVRQAVQTLGVTLTPDEHAAIIDHLDRNGGSIEQAIVDQSTRSLLNAEAGHEAIPAGQPVPGFEDHGGGAGAVAGPGEGAPVAAGRNPAPEVGGAPRHQEHGRAGQGAAAARPGELTTEPGAEGLPQYVVPGTEHRQTGEAQRQKAEVAARAQQSKIRKPGQQRIEDDETSMFGEKPADLFAAPAVDTGDTVAQDRGVPPRTTPQAAGTPPRVPAADHPSDTGSAADTTGRKPKGRMGPRFLDFSYTNKASVYGAAFRDAGLNPDEARNLPIDEQIRHVSRVLTNRYGVKVELPTVKVQQRNLVGRKVTVERQSITTREALDQLLDAYRGMQMLAHVMGVPEKALGLELDGTPITLSLVSTSRLKGALGMFSWGEKGRKITLPGRSNSFAHEWGHALDHFMSKQVGRDDLGGLLSRTVDKEGLRRAASPRADIREAYADILKAMFADKAKLEALILKLEIDSAEVNAEGNPTLAAARAKGVMEGIKAGKRPPAAYLSRYFETSTEYDQQQGTGGYFADPAEMFARAFEGFIGRAASAISDLPQGFLSKSGWGYESTDDARLAQTFPKDGSAEHFAVAMAELSHALSRMEIFGLDAPATAPADQNIFSDNALLKLTAKSSLGEREKRALRESVNALRRTLSKEETEKAAKEAKTNLRGVFETYMNSLTATLHSIAARQTTPEAKKVFTTIADHLGRDPGSGRVLGPVYQEEVERKTRQWMSKLERALAAFAGPKRQTMTEEDTGHLRDLLTGQKAPQASAAVKKLAGDMRGILNDVWYQLTSPKEGDLKVGFADGYLPRITDRQAVEDDSKGFTLAAAQVYSLMFDREVTQNKDEATQNDDIKTVISSLRAARMPTEEGESLPVSRLSDADEVLIAAWRVARKKLRHLRQLEEKNPNSPGIADKLANAEAAHDKAKRVMLAMLQDRFADASADHWRVAMRVGDQNDFDTMGPTASFLKGRVLPPETDQLMADYLITDPTTLLTGYIHAAARRSEYAKRFGATGEKLENMLRAAEEHGANAADIGLARMAVNSATGRFKHPNRWGEALSGFIFVTGTLRLLGRATFASLGEPVTAAVRSGYLRDAGKAIASNIRTLVRGKQRRELFELASVIGLVSSSINDGIMANRISADSAGLSPKLSHLVSKFYAKSLLTPLTNFQHVANLPVAHAILMRHLRETVNGKNRSFSDLELNELGIAREDRPDLLQWMEDLQSLPKPEDLLSPDGAFYNRAADLWAHAVTRLTHETIQSPLKSDRPIMANHPVWASLYGIMSFQQAFHRNILRRMFRRGVPQRETVAGKVGQVAWNLTYMAPPVAAMLLSQLLTTMIREALFNSSQFAQHDDDDDLWEWLLSRAFSRSGLTGVWDPIYQVYSGVKYERDIASALAGPMLGSALTNFQKIVQGAPGGARNSGNTAAAENNAAQGFYQLLIQPAIMGALAAYAPSGGLFALLTASAIWWGSGQEASKAFADAVTAPKGTNYEKDLGGEQPWWETGTLTPAQQKRADKRAAQGD